MPPENRAKTGRKPGTFTKGDPRINRGGRPKGSGEVVERLLEMSPNFLKAMALGLKVGDPEFLRIWAKHVLPTAQNVEVSGQNGAPVSIVIDLGPAGE